MSTNKKSVISTKPKQTRTKKLSGEAKFFRALDWTKHYVDYKTGLVEADEQTIINFAEYLNEITERGKHTL